MGNLEQTQNKNAEKIRSIDLNISSLEGKNENEILLLPKMEIEAPVSEDIQSPNTYYNSN